MEEHIDEMTKVLVDYTEKNHIMASHAILEDYAEQLYNAGYRKQKDGKWIVLAEFSDRSICTECPICGEEYTYKKGQIGEHVKTFYAEYNFCPNCGAHMKGGAE